MSYPIQVNLIPGLPKTLYNSGHYVGVVAHATAVYYDTPDSERNVEVSDWRNAFVHYFVGSGKIEQVADINYIAYGAGKTANHLGYAQVELCQTYDSAQFARDYSMYVWLLAKLLHDRGLGVVNGVTLMSHAQVSAKWGETDHTDPIDYLKSHGKTWNDVVIDVTMAYQEMEDFEMEHAVVYFTDRDFSSARMIADKLGYCAMYCRNGSNTFIHPDWSRIKHSVVVGGAFNINTATSTNCCGEHAEDTAILAANYAKTL